MSDKPIDQHDAAMQELRKLLFEKEATRIDELEKLIHDQDLHAKEVAKVLAEAVRLRNRTDDELGKSLAPTIEKSIKESIARDPKSLSDALFPVMGPAIRKSINNSIAMMLQSLNQTLEQSFSAQGLQWRWDALRTGKPFAEIVMLNTLVYRVEQVFLIHKETGLLLHHLSFDPTLHEDADVISSMLTAVQDFIQDSFSSSTEQGIENLRMGDLEVLIEQGPNTVLAVVCRGNPPRSLHKTMQETVEKVHHLFADELQQFDGDTSKFDAVDEVLSPLLVADFKNSGNKQKKSPFKAILAVSVLFLALLGWFGWEEAKQQKALTNWENYIAQLNSETGIIITHSECNEHGCEVRGLRDPLSTDPESLLAQYHLIKANTHLSFQPYYALQKDLILKRVIQLIQPPKSVQVSLQGQTLLLSGVASEIWLTQAEQAALYLAGIGSIDSTRLSILTSVFEDEQSTSIQLDSLSSKPKKSIIRKRPKPNKSHKTSDSEILKKAIALLKPPSTVQMVYTKGILYISGQSSSEWIESAKQKFSIIDGINSLYTYNLKIVRGAQ